MDSSLVKTWCGERKKRERKLRRLDGISSVKSGDGGVAVEFVRDKGKEEKKGK